MPVIAICTPTYDKPAFEYLVSSNLLLKPSSVGQLKGATHIIRTHGKAIVQARTELTEEALSAEPKVEYLLWIDDDMVPPNDAIARLLSWNLDIVGGLCHNRRYPSYQPILAKKHDPVWGLQEGTYGFIYDYPVDTRLEVDATGAGFLLVKREVFEAVAEKFGASSWWQPNEGEASEDFAFCERAKACGYKVHVDTGLDIGHVSTVIVNGASARRLRDFETNAWQSPELHSLVASGKPRATIVIPTYNQQLRYLRAAALSALNQTVPVEVIVVDDGSTPPVALSDLPAGVKLIRLDQNGGIAAALNAGIREMTTDWFCWLSSDDMLDPRKVKMQMESLMRGGHKAGFHRYSVVYVDRDQRFPHYALMPGWRTMAEQQATLREVCAINGSTIMVHKSVLDDVGGFSSAFDFSQDWEFFVRVGKRYFWSALDEILGTRREGHNLTASIEKDELLVAARDEEDEAVKRLAAEG